MAQIRNHTVYFTTSQIASTPLPSTPNSTMTKPMKTILAVCATAAISTFAFSAEIALKDGRVLKDASIVSQAPRTVMIKHANGLSSVAKELLPPELQPQYPVDEVAARQAEEKSIVARETAEKFHKAEAERVAAVRKQRAEAAAELKAQQADDTAHRNAERAAAKAGAQQLAKRYFERDYNWSTSTTPTYDVTIDDVRPVEGWPGRWFVSGRVLIRNYDKYQHGSSWDQPSPETHYASDDWRRQYDENQRKCSERPQNSDTNIRHVEPSHWNEPKQPVTPTTNDPSGNTKATVKPRHWNDPRHGTQDTPQHEPPLTQRNDPNYAWHDTDGNSTPSYTIETRNFEGYYSTESSEPTIDITMR